MNFFGFGSAAELEIEMNDPDTLKRVAVKKDNGDVEMLYMFTGDETVAGTLHLNLKAGKKLEHIGIKIELIGQIELLYDRGNPYEFLSLVKELESPGTLAQSKSYNFAFSEGEKEHETYTGANVRLRYFLRAKVSRSYSSNITKVMDFAVQNKLPPPPKDQKTVKMEVGIEDCLHIEFEYNKSHYHLQDVVIGKIYFLLVRIKIKHMEIVIVKRESTGSGSNAYNESENIAKFEIMDGHPARGESIPIRLFLAPYNLTNTYADVHRRFSVRYHLNLVLVDEEDRRYFKQQQIHLTRKKLSFVEPKVKVGADGDGDKGDTAAADSSASGL